MNVSAFFPLNCFLLSKINVIGLFSESKHTDSQKAKTKIKKQQKTTKLIPNYLDLLNKKNKTESDTFCFLVF